MKFTKQKNGYSEKEVDEYILSIASQHDKDMEEKDLRIAELEQKILEKKKQENSIAIALTAAVDKAKEIEMSSQNIYKLKIEQLTILYTKWEMFLNEMLKKYPDTEDVTNVKEDIQSLKNSIKTALKDEYNVDLMTKTPVTDPIRVLLNRLTGLKANAEARNREGFEPVKEKTIKRKTRVSTNDKTELTKLEEMATKIKPISKLNLKKDEEYENLVDKFLNTDDGDYSDKLAKTVLNTPDYSQNEGKFDLNEAINPTEDLEEIMKSFDFYKKK